ncbi:alpha-amylase family glycosyl hydrolase [Belliella kenyensis]|uniref:1,4-alpha-glucan branching enzyme n=1 Tax=Belliella kenyensis TaxID=1472724 RepID=A0ABV8EIU6_9BACT|nr:alpha-amylase family glycosyl hydrolase [Belliella kenyensis]MCH7400330.1 alpha-amylase family glycosyl hydrolase [Belliella kenyensis]MDN3604652.1 alpha-amylase family glycosyl hydrolase [Belliella kenyensis]
MKEEKYSGMGAILGPDGVTFRVWAPNAEKIFVIGSFNDWNESINEMEHEENGFWSFHSTDASEGDEYKFIIHYRGNVLHRNDPYALKMTNSVGNSVVYDLWRDFKNHEFMPPPLNELVIYELHIGTFNREGKDGDQVGDFYTAAKKLDYIKDLGINAVEIMPVAEFPGDNSWGYNPANPFAVEEAYGGPDALKHFIFEAHMRGIAVILDVVYNHLGPSDLALWQFDGWEENGMGGIYFYNDERASTPWGDTRPDYGRPEVRNYLRDNAMLWLEAFQCDGLRFDATAIIRLVNMEDHNGPILEEGVDFLKSLNHEIKEKFPHKILIAEDLKSDSSVTAALDQGGLGFDCQWGVGFSHILRNVLTISSDQDRSLQTIENLLYSKFNDDIYQKVIYTESHDEVANMDTKRLPEEIQPGDAEGEYAKKKSTLGALIVFTAPGIPMIFQGQEFLTFEHFQDSKPIDWGRLEHFGGIVNLYRDLINFRKSSEGFARGLNGQGIEVLHRDEEGLVLVYTRFHQDDATNPAIVVLNFSVETKYNYQFGIHQDGSWNVIFNSGWSGYDQVFAEVEVSTIHSSEGINGKQHALTVDIPSYGGLILTR